MADHACNLNPYFFVTNLSSISHPRCQASMMGQDRAIAKWIL